MQHDRVKVRFLSRGNIFAMPSMTILTRLPTGRQDMSVVVVVVVTVNLYKINYYYHFHHELVLVVVA